MLSIAAPYHCHIRELCRVTKHTTNVAQLSTLTKPRNTEGTDLSRESRELRTANWELKAASRGLRVENEAASAERRRAMLWHGMACGKEGKGVKWKRLLEAYTLPSTLPWFVLGCLTDAKTTQADWLTDWLTRLASQLTNTPSQRHPAPSPRRLCVKLQMAPCPPEAHFFLACSFTCFSCCSLTRSLLYSSALL